MGLKIHDNLLMHHFSAFPISEVHVGQGGYFHALKCIPPNFGFGVDGCKLSLLYCLFCLASEQIVIGASTVTGLKNITIKKNRQGCWLSFSFRVKIKSVHNSQPQFLSGQFGL